jgi:predicted HAD superfamily Cof-like phosphohydrolase
MTDVFYGSGFVATEEATADDLFVNALALSNFKKVYEFMEVFGQECRDFPSFPEERIQQLRQDLIEEEFNELKQAIAEKDVVGVADALSDLLYVVYGTGIAFGIDLDACFAEVHASNMSKLGEDGKPIFRDDGKVLKGPNYFKPDLFNVMFQNQGSPEPETMDVVSCEAREDGLYDVTMKDQSGVHHTFVARYDIDTESLQLL